jgi:hypothetical protein
MSTWTRDELDRSAKQRNAQSHPCCYAVSIVGSIVSPQARAATLKLVPR